MKKLMAAAIALALVVFAFAPVRADVVGGQNPVKATIRTMGALGNGLAISQSNPLDFQLLKIGVAGVSLAYSGSEETVKIGVLYFGEDKYRLKNATLGNGTASANVYDNETLVGSISLTSYPKGDTEIWAGTLTLNGTAYNAYVIQAKRDAKPVEKAENVKEYCTNNPEKCKAVMKAVGQILCDPATDGNCRDKIKTFCEAHPDDSRCKKLDLAFCALNLNDSTCRQQIIQACQLNATGSNNDTNVTSDACERLGNLYEKKMGNATGFLKHLPDWYNKVVEKSQETRKITASHAGAITGQKNEDN